MAIHQLWVGRRIVNKEWAWILQEIAHRVLPLRHQRKRLLDDSLLLFLGLQAQNMERLMNHDNENFAISLSRRSFHWTTYKVRVELGQSGLSMVVENQNRVDHREKSEICQRNPSSFFSPLLDENFFFVYVICGVMVLVCSSELLNELLQALWGWRIFI